MQQAAPFHFRLLLAGLMSLLVMATGQGLAMARGAPEATGRVEICSGHGPVMLYTDAQGQPTAPPEYCPENALTLLHLIAAAVATPERPATRLTLTYPALRIAGRSHPAQAARARAPPA